MIVAIKFMEMLILISILCYWTTVLVNLVPTNINIGILMAGQPSMYDILHLLANHVPCIRSIASELNAMIKVYVR